MTQGIFRLPLLSLFFLLSPAAGEAATMQFEVGGACNYNCGVFGLEDGGALTGRIRVDDAAFSPGATVGNAALVSYQFRMGSFRFRDTDAADPGFFMTWGDSSDAIDSLQISAFVSNDRDRPAPALEVYFAPFLRQAILTNDGYQWRGGLFNETSFGDAAYASVDSVGPAPVPLPAAGWLLVAGGGALFAARRMRRRPA